MDRQLPVMALLLAWCGPAAVQHHTSPAASALPTAIFNASGPGAAGCYRSPTLLSTGSRLLALAAHHWDSRESACNDVGLKAVVIRTSMDGVTCVCFRCCSTLEGARGPPSHSARAACSLPPTPPNAV